MLNSFGGSTDTLVSVVHRGRVDSPAAHSKTSALLRAMPTTDTIRRPQLGSEGLEELDRIAGRVVDENLLAALARDDIAPEAGA
jgi:hypothetical protein